jgi:hypothetical protein
MGFGVSFELLEIGADEFFAAVCALERNWSVSSFLGFYVGRQVGLFMSALRSFLARHVTPRKGSKV